MGYMGLSDWVESDRAADFVHTMFDGDKALNRMRKQLKQKDGYGFNTEGVVNVGLFLEMFRPNATLPLDWGEFIAHEFTHKMEEYIEQVKKAEWDDAGNKRSHLKAYRRMLLHSKKLIGL